MSQWLSAGILASFAAIVFVSYSSYQRMKATMSEVKDLIGEITTQLGKATQEILGHIDGLEEKIEQNDISVADLIPLKSLAQRLDEIVPDAEDVPVEPEDEDLPEQELANDFQGEDQFDLE